MARHSAIAASKIKKRERPRQSSDPIYDSFEEESCLIAAFKIFAGRERLVCQTRAVVDRPKDKIIGVNLLAHVEALRMKSASCEHLVG